MIGMLRMDRKTAIVTGGASGIGFGVVRFLSEMGASVALFDVDKTHRINRRGGGVWPWCLTILAMSARSSR